MGLASRPVRDRLQARLGRWGFMGVFYVVASLTFTALVSYYATHRFAGAAGPALAGGLGGLLGAVGALGVVLVGVGLFDYPRSAYAFSNLEADTPRGIETVTRHPFFVGLVLLGTSHALLATRLVGVAFMAGLAAFALLGAVHQDRKLLRLRGAPYATFLSRTSLLPFGAVLLRHTPLSAAGLPWRSLALGVGLAVGLRLVHEGIFAHGGVYVIATTVGGALVFAVEEWLRERRRDERATGTVAS